MDASNSHKQPRTVFWAEEPVNQKRAWRPTDEVFRKLKLLWLVQGALLAGLCLVGLQIAKESKNMPPIFAKLPNGMVLGTTTGPLKMDRLARTEMVNNVLPLIYYRNGGDNYLNQLTNSVKPDILLQFASDAHAAQRMTNNTVHLDIMETFEIINVPAGFEAMTKGSLFKRTRKEEQEKPLYIRTHWEVQDQHYVLTRLYEEKSPVYTDAFLKEKDKLRKMDPKELERELNVRRNTEIQVPTRKSLF